MFTKCQKLCFITKLAKNMYFCLVDFKINNDEYREYC